MDFKDLSPEQREKALACETVDDLVSLAEEEGYPLTDEQIESISGGDDWICTDYSCPDDDIW